MAIYYKVVRVNQWGEYCSAIVDGKACLRYALGERTEGFEGMPVLLFSSLTAAREFCVGRDVILSGTAGNPRRQERICDLYRGVLGFHAFWQGTLGAPQSTWSAPAPWGTYAADWFEPKRVVGGA